MNNDQDISNNEFDSGGVALMSLTHAVHDTYSGFLPALLPILIDKFSFSNFLSPSFEMQSRIFTPILISIFLLQYQSR